jgi:hypothetical protein
VWLNIEHQREQRKLVGSSLFELERTALRIGQRDVPARSVVSYLRTFSLLAFKLAYSSRIRIIGCPFDFFSRMSITVDQILDFCCRTRFE